MYNCYYFYCIFHSLWVIAAQKYVVFTHLICVISYHQFEHRGSIKKYIKKEFRKCCLIILKILLLGVFIFLPAVLPLLLTSPENLLWSAIAPTVAFLTISSCSANRFPFRVVFLLSKRQKSRGASQESRETVEKPVYLYLLKKLALRVAFKSIEIYFMADSSHAHIVR